MLEHLSFRSPSPRVADFEFDLDSPPASPPACPCIADTPSTPALLADLPARASAGPAVRFLPPTPQPPIDEALLSSPLPESLARVLALMREDMAWMFSAHSCGGRVDAWLGAGVACIMGLPIRGHFSHEERLILRADTLRTSPEVIFDRSLSMLEATLWLNTRKISMIAREQCEKAGARREDVEHVIWHLEAYTGTCVQRLHAMGPRR